MWLFVCVRERGGKGGGALSSHTLVLVISLPLTVSFSQHPRMKWDRTYRTKARYERKEGYTAGVVARFLSSQSFACHAGFRRMEWHRNIAQDAILKRTNERTTHKVSRISSE